MQKILLFLSFVIASMGMVRLNAYCFHNRSDNQKITVHTYSSKIKSKISPLFLKTDKELLPKGGKTCWNWKDIDKKNRKKEWYWIAFKIHETKETLIWKLGEGYFPIGGNVSFLGYDKNGKSKFNIYFGPDSKSMPPWEYRKSPWNHKSQPWKTYKG